jgi:hypothetical protein
MSSHTQSSTARGLFTAPWIVSESTDYYKFIAHTYISSYNKLQEQGVFFAAV